MLHVIDGEKKREKEEERRKKEEKIIYFLLILRPIFVGGRDTHHTMYAISIHARFHVIN